MLIIRHIFAIDSLNEIGYSRAAPQGVWFSWKLFEK
jgi:hypothetical protein